jgi:hypothetical protein
MCRRRKSKNPQDLESQEIDVCRAYTMAAHHGSRSRCERLIVLSKVGQHWHTLEDNQSWKSRGYASDSNESCMFSLQLTAQVASRALNPSQEPGPFCGQPPYVHVLAMFDKCTKPETSSSYLKKSVRYPMPVHDRSRRVPLRQWPWACTFKLCSPITGTSTVKINEC